MSIILRRVEVSNMRSHKHYIFEPEREGITAIRGANGAGKSTIVDSIAWAMYGSKPAGVSKTSALYRSGATWGVDKCFARVEIEIDGTILLVERRMITKAGAVECDVWRIVEDENGHRTRKHLAGTAVSQVEVYLRQRLRMDEQGFLAAILVQQKQVDALISATARERAQVIEKLTGISAITSAFEQARAQLKDLKKSSAVFTSNATDITDIRDHITSVETSRDKKISEIERKRKKKVALQQKVEELSESYREKVSVYNEAEKLRNELLRVETQLSGKKEEYERLDKDKSERKERLSVTSGGTDADEIERSISELRARVESLALELSRHQDRRESFGRMMEQSSGIVGDVVDISSPDDAHRQMTEQKGAVTAEEKTARKADREAAALHGESKKIARAVKVLTDGDGTCPTCLQKVPDVSTVVEILEDQRSEVERQAAESERQAEKARERAEVARGRISALDTYVKACEVLKDAQEGAQAEDKKVTELDELLGRTRIDLTANEKVYNKVRVFREQKREYEHVLHLTQKAFLDLEKLTDRQEKISSSLKKIRVPSKKAVDSERQRLDERNGELMTASVEVERLIGERDVILQELTALRKDYDRETAAAKKYKALLSQIEIQSNVVSVIEDFREDRIQSSVPVIEVYASDLLSRFTDGKFVQLKMDKKFNASVVLKNGTSRPVGLLSGGELSAAAMALRISISMLLNGGQSKNLIVLDEVLVSQDEDRAELMLGTIREVCKGQVILIAHSDIVDSISDNVVEITP